MMIAGSPTLGDYGIIAASFLAILWLLAFLIERMRKRKRK